jgi:CHASE2 domain-containing sensor protein
VRTDEARSAGHQDLFATPVVTHCVTLARLTSLARASDQSAYDDFSMTPSVFSKV